MKIKVLQYVSSMNRAGSETLLMNIYRNIDIEKFEFHFTTHTKEKGDYDDEIKRLGGRVIYLDRPSALNPRKFKKDFKNLVDENGPYDVIHSHMQLMNGFILKTAKEIGIQNRISHAHLNGDYNKTNLVRILYRIYSKNAINKSSTKRIACSNPSGKYLYGKRDFILLNNAVDLKKFNNREKYKYYLHKEFRLTEKAKIITHIGRFVEAKNHKFIIEVFSKVVERDKAYRLFLCGNGELVKDIKKLVKSKNLENYVKFLGVRKDINKILLSTDVFFMPSILEGLPVALVEAQAAGCKCILSNNIPKEIDLELDQSEYMSLAEDIDIWVDNIELYYGKDKLDYSVIEKKILEKGYSLKKNVENLEGIYGGEK